MQSTNGKNILAPLIEVLPLEILDRIVEWLSEGQVNICGLSKDSERFPPYTYITNNERCNGCYRDLLSLSSTSRTMRIKVGGVLFRNISLVRQNQIDSVLSTPRSRQLYSDEKAYHREFIKEVISGNIENCSKSELARSSFKHHIIGDQNYFFDLYLMFCIYIYIYKHIF